MLPFPLPLLQSTFEGPQAPAIVPEGNMITNRKLAVAALVAGAAVIRIALLLVFPAISLYLPSLMK
jgi:hypothetical protein